MGEAQKKSISKEGIQKPTYEELTQYCNQLLSQRNQVAEKLNQITNVVNKLPWLFKVIENASAFNEEFVSQCKIEIEGIMTPPEEVSEDTENKE